MMRAEIEAFEKAVKNIMIRKFMKCLKENKCNCGCNGMTGLKLHELYNKLEKMLNA